MKELGIYVHIPFCKKKCNYCDFISFSDKQEMVERYVEKLKKEIKDESKNCNLEEYNISTVYIGGGTPSYIESKYIVEVLDAIRENFILKNNAEITIEINPGTVDKSKMQDYYNSGINRLSIGLQTTDDNLLKVIGRIHTYEQFLETYKMAKEVGFNNINVDLMIGLPTQTIKDVEKSIKEISSINPTHISVYSLILEEGTKLAELVEAKKVELPEEKLEREMYWYVKRKLEEQGYTHYEISNFAKNGYESKHNLNCWEQKEYLGFGLAAHSYFNSKRYSNSEDLEKYINNKNQEIHEIQTNESKMKEYMLLRIEKNKRNKNIRF